MWRRHCFPPMFPHMPCPLSSAVPQVGMRVLLSPLTTNVVSRTACCTIGIAFPVYSTFKAIESKDRSEQEKWLLYWAVFGSFSLVEVFSDKILSWFPFYYHVKFAFLVWLQLPSGNGSRHLYLGHLRPFLLRHQDKFDLLHDFTTREIVKFSIAHQGEIQFMKALLKKCASTVMLKDTAEPGQSSEQNVVIRDPNPPRIEEVEDDDD